MNALTLVIIVVTFISTGIDIPDQDECVARFVDFHAIWGAARLALDFNPIAAFNRETLEQAYSACGTVNLYWLYPAPMAVAIMPLGALPFIPAYVGFQFVSIGLLALCLRRYFPDDLTALFAIAFAPAWLPALLVGQFTILWCVGLLAAISAMRQDRHILAGLFFALLTLKPTLGLLIPIVLLADRRYLTIIAATVITVVLHAGATAIYGFAYFTRWIEVSSNHGASIAAFFAESQSMSSFAALIARLGAPTEIAIYSNIALLIVMVPILFWAWRKYGAQSDHACALLCAAIPLSTPYLWHYDAGISALVALFIYRAAYTNRGPLFWLILGIILGGPGITLWNTYFFQIPWIYPTIIVPSILLLAFAFSLLQLRTGQPAAKT